MHQKEVHVAVACGVVVYIQVRRSCIPREDADVRSLAQPTASLVMV